MLEALLDGFGLLGSEFWAAIAGASVGGVITYFIQLQSLREARRGREESQLAENRALGYSLLFKTLAIWNNFFHLKNHVDQARQIQAAGGFDILSSVLRPLASLSDPVKYDAREMSLLLSLQEDKTFNAVLSQDAIHNGILPVWSLYAQKREQLHDAAESLGIDLSSGVGNIRFPIGSIAERLFFEVDELAVVLAERADKDEAEARAARDILLGTLKQKLGLTIGVG
jgi:hypothetical protein